jgi:hypothetical protein
VSVSGIVFEGTFPLRADAEVEIVLDLPGELFCQTAARLVLRGSIVAARQARSADAAVMAARFSGHSIHPGQAARTTS